MSNVTPIRPRDPVIDLLLEEEAVRALGDSYYDQAEAAQVALDPPELVRALTLKPVERPAPIGPLYAEAARYHAAADELFERIGETRATTIAGVIALLEGVEYPDARIEAAIESLRALAPRLEISRRGGTE